jgi:hypothetical protein
MQVGRDGKGKFFSVAYLYGRQSPVGVRRTSSVLAKSNACFLVEDVVVDVSKVPHGKVGGELHIHIELHIINIVNV